jgi:hypothetical protein
MKTLLSLLFTPPSDDTYEWELFGRQVAVGQKITASVPVGKWIASSEYGGLYIEAVGGAGITLRSHGNLIDSGISIFATKGDTVTVGSMLWIDYFPAIRIKVLSVDPDAGIARLEVSQFRSDPGKTQIDKVE